MKDKKASFEDDMKRLQKIVEELSSGKLALEESLKKYEEGVKIAKRCSSLLSEAQRKVEVLMKKDGRFELQEFDDKDTIEPR